MVDYSSMKDTAERLFALEPAGMAAEDDGWQKRKSAQTRLAILDAAIDCLAEFGYSRTTTQLIAQKANISRGAMIHHYATKQDLIDSVIDYTFYKRLEGLSERVRQLSEYQRVVEQAGIEEYWNMLLTPAYQAYLELAIAARTDEELRATFLPKARRFDQIWGAEIAGIFPEWSDKREKLQLATDFCIAAMEGLALNRTIWEQRSRRQAVRRVVSLAILMVRDDDLGDKVLAGL
ncbi:MAG: TetR/AcrR family transcriptional regulator [Alphaproteobacteria bacterium]|nr:TetR/AcrR family transcriptional regulator [Alphaproteobacteria bacterium]